MVKTRQVLAFTKCMVDDISPCSLKPNISFHQMQDVDGGIQMTTRQTKARKKKTSAKNGNTREKKRRRSTKQDQVPKTQSSPDTPKKS